jgi:hypothetical protein
MRTRYGQIPNTVQISAQIRDRPRIGAAVGEGRRLFSLGDPLFEPNCAKIV